MFNSWIDNDNDDDGDDNGNVENVATYYSWDVDKNVMFQIHLKLSWNGSF